MYLQKSDFTTDALFADVNDWKWCNRCGGFRPRDKFHANKVMKDGLQGYCIDCFQQLLRESRENFGAMFVSGIISNAKERAKTRGVPFAINKYHIQELINKLSMKDGVYMCPRLYIPLIIGVTNNTRNSPTLDAIRPVLGYIPGNIQIVSSLYNIMKSDIASEEEWVAYARRAIESIENEKQTTEIRQAQGTNGVTAAGVFDGSEQDPNIWLN